jgi:hypothetical protein
LQPLFRYLRRHRRHYFGVFAPNAPLRKPVVANAGRSPENFVPLPLRHQSEKVYKVSLEWATLIARIYEVHPLVCSVCGGKVKIIGFVTHRAEILRVLREVGWPLEHHEFDPAEDFPEWSVSQLLPDTSDGFPEMGSQENIYWSEKDQFQSTGEKLEASSFRDGGEGDPAHWHLEESDCNPLPFHWDHSESYCDPPHEEIYGADPPHEWD